MARDGVYRSQFVTGTSNGGLTAYPGGDRWRWESRIFAGAYDDAAPDQRPVYGALNYRRDPMGGAPRFGSSYFRLTPEALTRATFCYPDSSAEPSAFGIAGRCSLLELAEVADTDLLDNHIEAQIHGPVGFDRDVEALVLDPSYRGTPVESAAEYACRAPSSGIPVFGSAWTNCGGIGTTAVRRMWIWEPRSLSVAGSLRGSSEMPPAQVDTPSRTSRRSGTVWPGSGGRAADSTTRRRAVEHLHARQRDTARAWTTAMGDGGRRRGRRRSCGARHDKLCFPAS
jgi:hypothetical protein